MKRAYEKGGFLVTRSPQSGSEYDLMCTNGDGRVYLTQVKSRGYLRPAEKEALVELAERFDAVPELAWIEDGVVKRRNLKGGELSELAC